MNPNQEDKTTALTCHRCPNPAVISVAGQLLCHDCNLKLAKAWEDATASVHGLSPHYDALILGGRHEPRSLDIDAVNVHRIALALRRLSHTDLPALGGILAALAVLLISEKNLEACKKNELLELLAAICEQAALPRSQRSRERLQTQMEVFHKSIRHLDHVAGVWEQLTSLLRERIEAEQCTLTIQ